MTDTGIRLMIIVAVFAVAALVAFGQRRARAVRRVRRTFPDLEQGLVLFVSGGCSTCQAARAVLDEVGAAHREIAYDDDPAVFARLSIGRVPALAEVDSSGAGWIAYGIPSVRAVRRWLANP